MKALIYELFNYAQINLLGPAMRNYGRKIYEFGNKVEGPELCEDRLVPSLRRLTHQGKTPDLEQTDWVAPNATVLGSVSAGERSSIWYGATLIGTSGIQIGSNTVIQDRVHISRNVKIGNHVFVGPNSILQGSTLHDRAFVAMGATIRHATVHSGGFVAAGAVVHDNVQVKEGEIWAGSPAKFLRNITPLERQILREHLNEMQDLACMHAQQTEKSFKEILLGQDSKQNSVTFDQFMNDPFNDTTSRVFHHTESDSEYAERRLHMKETIIHPDFETDYEPYKFQNKSMPQKFRMGIHEEEFTKIALKLKQKEEFQFTSENPWSSKY